MALLIPSEGRAFIFKKTFHALGTVSYKMRLYVNDKVPADTDTVLNYTEMSANGYNPLSLSDDDFNITVTNGENALVISEQGFTFNQGIPVTIYGYYLTATINGIDTLIFAERFVQSKAVQFSTDKVEVQPTIFIDQQ